MTIPLTREITVSACKKMMDFHNDLSDLFGRHDMDLLKNRGRRNILMSEPMERFLAEGLDKTGLFEKVVSDGRTGFPDIVVESSTGDYEIECKLTSPHQSSGTIAFQTDHDTLVRKGKLDYVYIIANESFDGFCALYFKDLTAEDFRDISPGARGKVQMYKHKGMKKATVLMGKAISHDEKKIQKIVLQRDKKIALKKQRISSLKTELENLKPEQNYLRKKINRSLLSARNYIDEVVNNADDSIRMIRLKDKSSYSFEFETIG